MSLKLLKNRRGITMPEIMASISVMAILAGTGVTSAVNQINQARITTTMDEMLAISLALSDYHRDNPGATISSISTLVNQGYLAEGFTEATDSTLETDWKQDAWDNNYVLVPPSIDSDGDYVRGSLTSPGADGILTDDSGTTGVDESDDNVKITLEPMVAGN